MEFKNHVFEPKAYLAGVDSACRANNASGIISRTKSTSTEVGGV